MGKFLNPSVTFPIFNFEIPLLMQNFSADQEWLGIQMSKLR